MVNQGTRVGRAMFTVGVVVAVGVAGAASAGAGAGSSLHGVFTETVAGSDAGYDIHGSAKMRIGPAGTVVKINVAGLDPDLTYGSHLHREPCDFAATPGGGHYQDIPSATAVTPPNELWLTTGTYWGDGLVSNPGGVAHAAGSAPWQARVDSDSTNARSVVVHAPGGAKIACADLR